MRIEKGQLIAGYPVLKVRDFFRRYEQYSVANTAYFFALSTSAAKALCLGFVDLGYSKRIPPSELSFDQKRQLRYTLLPLGRSLRLARAVAPISRQKADKIFADFMTRVQEVNTNDYYVYKVDKVLLFGSYIRSEVMQVGDIDIAVNIVSKYDDPEVRQLKDEAYTKRAAENGRQFNDWLAEMFFPSSDVKTFLKNRSQYISLHTLDDQVLTVTETVQVYPA